MENPEDWDAEARANAVKSLMSVCQTLTRPTESSNLLSKEDSNYVSFFIKCEIMHSLLKALDDYCVDNRGDVGSWVREAAINGLEKCINVLCENGSLRSSRKHGEATAITEISEESNAIDNHAELSLDVSIAKTLVSGLAKQAVEKMDKIRESAAKVLQRIIYNKTYFIPLPLRERLEEMIPEDSELDWKVRGVWKIVLLLLQSFCTPLALIEQHNCECWKVMLLLQNLWPWYGYRGFIFVDMYWILGCVGKLLIAIFLLKMGMCFFIQKWLSKSSQKIMLMEKTGDYQTEICSTECYKIITRYTTPSNEYCT